MTDTHMHFAATDSIELPHCSEIITKESRVLGALKNKARRDSFYPHIVAGTFNVLFND